MGKSSIDFLFSEQRGTKPTKEWFKIIQDNKSKYEKCKLVSFTRVKDLNSNWKHEYTQFIVEDEETKERARVYAERGNEVNLDWVTFGPRETVTSGSKHAVDLPLPLTSFIFGGKDGKDPSKRPSVLQMAEILASTTVVGGKYELYGHSCFWYAYTVTLVVERDFGMMATKKNWNWINVGGAGNAGWRDAVGLGVPMLFKWRYVGDAKKFKKQRETDMVFANDPRELLDQASIVSQVADDLATEKYLNNYLAVMEREGLEMDRADVEARLAASKQTASQEGTNADGTVPDFTKEFDQVNKQIVERVYTDPEAERMIKFYESFEVPPASDEGEQVTGPNAEAITATQQALKIVVGRILEQVQEYRKEQKS